MRMRILAWLLFALIPLIAQGAAQAAEQEPLPPDQVYRFSAQVQDANTISAQWALPDGYYLYRSKFKFTSDTPGVKLGEANIPAGHKKKDDLFGEVEILRHTIKITIPVVRGADAPNKIKLVAVAQGCADLGVCYPPHESVAMLDLPAAPAAAAAPGESKDAVKAVSDLGDSLGLQDNADEFLPADQAFSLNSTAMGANGDITARWAIADGYYMYRERLKFRLKDAPAGVSLGQPKLPAGEMKDDEALGKTVEVYHHGLEAKIPVVGAHAGQTLALELTYQGCAEAGLCYPPITKTVSLNVPAGTSAAAAAAPAATAQAPAPSTPAAQPPETEQDQLLQILQQGNLWLILGAFFVAGLGLALTPCVFPMIPILSGIIVGQGASITTRKAFTLSLVYVLAMALTYTVAGVLAAMFGSNLQAAFQNPWVLSLFAAIFVGLALSMFGFYDIQMPSFLQSKLTDISNRQKGGTLTGVAVMGFLSALIVGPCVAAPLAAALIFIGQTGDPVLGGEALFALSLGMGAPLLLIGTSGGKLLPRAGMWMDAVKAVFGVILLGVAVWMLERIVPGAVAMLLWALLTIVSAIYMGALEPLAEGAGGWRKLWKGLGVALLIYGAVLLIGAASGRTDPLAPLSGGAAMYGTVMPGAAGSAGAVPAAAHGLAFKRFKGIDGLNRELAAAKGKRVMVDFYADWCISCKEFEKYVFSDPRVAQALGDTVLLQADVTDNDAADKALMKHFKIIGPPTIMFFGPDGKEMSRYRVVGYMEPQAFLARVQSIIK